MCAECFPEALVLSEESPLPKRSEILLRDGILLILDPIDGTQNVIGSLPLYCLSIGGFKIEDGDLYPLFGLIGIPATGEIFYTCDDKVCELNVFTGEKNTIHERQSNIRKPELFLVNDYHLISLATHSDYSLMRFRCTGSTALDALYTALGASRGCIVSAYLWDFAGAWAIANRLGLHFWQLDTNVACKHLGNKHFHDHPQSKEWLLSKPLLLSKEDDVEHCLTVLPVKKLCGEL